MKNKGLFFILMLVLIFPILQAPNGFASEVTNEKKLEDFYANVVGLDLTKYSLVFPSGDEYQSNMSKTLPKLNQTKDTSNDLVEEQYMSPQLEYEGKTINTMAFFSYGNLLSVKVYSDTQNEFIYSEPQPASILERTKNILQRYQTFVSQKYGKDASFLVPMQNVLNGIDELSPMEVTVENMRVEVTVNGDQTSIQWIYTQKDALLKSKMIKIEFHNNKFESFKDTWSFFRVSEAGGLSSEEAVEIALEAAQNLEIPITNEHGETKVFVASNLSDAPCFVNWDMVPFREPENFSSSTSRDSFTLYSYWNIRFYFKEEISRISGIDVGIWGDTGEISYCSIFGFHSISGPPNQEETSNQPADEQELELQKQPNTADQTTLVIIVTLVAALITVTAIIAFRKKKNNQAVKNSF